MTGCSQGLDKLEAGDGLIYLLVFKVSSTVM